MMQIRAVPGPRSLVAERLVFVHNGVVVSARSTNLCAKVDDIKVSLMEQQHELLFLVARKAGRPVTHRVRFNRDGAEVAGEPVSLTTAASLAKNLREAGGAIVVDRDAKTLVFAPDGGFHWS
ncbi:MAG: hypothetical protein KGI41_02240 [Patescibacteria group bacterium]|nr:hypothetical protein [Patescibacteria group bacterium]MDE1966033.1 hypothetical protein [Patescibacteria group bacterium]